MTVTARTFAKYNPATGRLICEYPVADEATVRQAVESARQCRAVWAKTPLKMRARVLRTVARLLYERADALASVISEETGKPLLDSLEADIGSALNALTYYADIGPRQLKPHRLSPDPISFITLRTHRETYHPRGVIAIISPWNYPVGIATGGLAATLMAGNTVILKPSEHAPACGEKLVALFQEALRANGLPPEIAQVVLGDGETGACLIDQAIDGVIFTGSDRVGREISEKAAVRGLWTSLELGGSDAMIVLEGCDLELAASYAVWGRFANAGQACAAVKRLFVSARDEAQLLKHLQAKIAQLRVGPPGEALRTPTIPGADNTPASHSTEYPLETDRAAGGEVHLAPIAEHPAETRDSQADNTSSFSSRAGEAHLGPLISEAQRERVDAQVRDAIAQGATLLAGGKPIPGPGWFYEPTLFTKVPSGARILQEEVFGPVLPVIPYQAVDDAIAQVNRSAFGLTASLFGDRRTAADLAEQLHCGTVVINDVGTSNFAMVCAPWGGWKASGTGASHGAKALLELSQVQIVSDNGMRHMPFLEKPMWHFAGPSVSWRSRVETVLAFCARHPRQWHPKTWLAFWIHRASTKL